MNKTVWHLLFVVMDSALRRFICCAVIVGFTMVLPANAHSPDFSSDAYFGCFRDIGQYGTFAKKVNATKREPVSCRERCRNESATYIGLWGGGNCWCAYRLHEKTMPNTSSNFDLLEKVNDSQCNESCADNSSLSCGGFTDEADYNIYSVYLVCPKTKFGTKQCKLSCNCKDDNHCSVGGICPHNECAPGWKLNVTKANRAICNTDVDECKGNSSLCDQMCNNTDGSYFCSCTFGYSLDQNDRRKCNDVDECQTNNGNCNQKCTNTDGSYFCSCFRGYQLQNDSHICEDIDECTKNRDNCSQQCTNSVGSYECKCHEGYELENDRHSCKDIDECSRNLSECNQNCMNTIGHYNCSCFSGFKLKDEHICIDVDECEINKGGCQHYCNNAPGSFSCSCPPGFRSSTSGSVNEETIYNCTDIDECCEGSANCVQNCINSIGNYTCSCHFGFQLQDDRFSCNVLLQLSPEAAELESSALGLRIGLISACCVIVILLGVIILMYSKGSHRLSVNADQKSKGPIAAQPIYEAIDKDQRIIAGSSNEAYEELRLNDRSIQTGQYTNVILLSPDHSIN